MVDTTNLGVLKLRIQEEFNKFQRALDEHRSETQSSVDSLATGVARATLVDALRLATGSSGDRRDLKGYTTEGDGGGGNFYWSDTPATDDGGTILNSGGIGSSSSGWRRIYSDTINTKWFGAKLDDSTDDTTAVQLAINAAATRSAIVDFGDNTAKVSTITISNPTHIRIGKGGIRSTASNMFVLSDNLRLDGQSPAETFLRPATGGTAINTTDWAFVEEGDHFLEVRNVRFEGGAKHIDTSTLTQFQGALYTIENCIFANATVESCPIADSVFYTFFDKCQFLFNESASTIGQATETIFTDCFFEQKSTGGPSITLNGAHHVRFNRCDFFGYAGNTEPDVLLVAINDGATGYNYFHDCRFGSERELSLSTVRRRVVVFNVAEPTFALNRLVFRGCEFLRPSGFAFTSIGRASNVATATVSTGWDSIGHQCEVGDVVHVINTTDPSFSGEHTITAKTLTTISWSSTGSDVAQAFGGGLVAGAGTCAISLKNPVAGLDIDECLFENYAYALDDIFVETQDSRGRSGGNIWGPNNRITGPLGLATQETKSGSWRGFTRAYADQTSPMLPLLEPARETQGLRNRIQLSEDLTGWGVVGFTNTAGQTDPLGGSTAFKIARAGTDQIVTDSGTGWGTTEGTVRAIDESGLGQTAWLQIWGKKGTTRTLWLMIIDAAGRTQWAKTLTLGTTWKQYKLPIALTSGYTSPLSLVVSCGGVNAQAGDCYVWHPAIDDYGGDYLPTATAAYATSTAGSNFERTVVCNGLNATSVNVSGLTASKIVVTDSSKNLTSGDTVATTATADTIAKRDASGGLAVDDLNANTVTATSTSADSPISRINGGHATLSSFTDANYTASAAEAACQTILVPNVPINGDRYLAIASTAGRVRVVHNSNATYNILVIQSGFTGLSATVPPQSTRIVFFDGTNMW